MIRVRYGDFINHFIHVSIIRIFLYLSSINDKNMTGKETMGGKEALKEAAKAAVSSTKGSGVFCHEIVFHAYNLHFMPYPSTISYDMLFYSRKQCYKS